MKILITNDDGVRAEQLLPLIQWVTAQGHEVTTVVPKVEQSGKSHSIELHKPFEIQHVELADGVWVYTVDSAPADCVRYAVLGLEQRYDLVISGINRGLNLGHDIMYSGTIGAVYEAVSQGLKSIALSTAPEYYDQAIQHLEQVFDYLRDHRLLEMHDLYNINIPPQPKGVKITRQGGHYYSDNFIHMEGDLYKPVSKCIYEDRGDLTLDTDAVTHGYISIMPLAFSRTDLTVYERLTRN